MALTLEQLSKKFPPAISPYYGLSIATTGLIPIEWFLEHEAEIQAARKASPGTRLRWRGPRHGRGTDARRETAHGVIIY